jgi:hypothetical protein
LAPYLGWRIRVVALFDCFGKDVDPGGRGKPFPTALVQDVEVDGEQVASHCWVQQCWNFQPLDLRNGDKIEFDAVVMRFRKCAQESGASYDDYSLTDPTRAHFYGEPTPMKPIRRIEQDQAPVGPKHEEAKRSKKAQLLFDLEKLREDYGAEEVKKALAYLEG